MSVVGAFHDKELKCESNIDIVYIRASLLNFNR